MPRAPDHPDRVFTLLWRTTTVADAPDATYRQPLAATPRLVPVATLRSLGPDDMFWERFAVTPHQPEHPALYDRDAWDRCDFILRHERTGILIEDVFSAGRGAPFERGGDLAVTLRGTSFFVPPPPTIAHRLARLAHALRRRVSG